MAGASGGMLRRLWHRAYYRAACVLWRAVLLAVRVRSEGAERLPRGTPYILVCNHISHFDPPTLAALLRRKHAWVVAADMYAHPLAAWFFRGIESIEVDRAAADLRTVREIVRRLKRGEPVGLFPEAGIRSGAASVLGGTPFDETVGGLACVAGVPLVPVVILGTDKLYSRGAWRRSTTLYVRVGNAIAPDGERTELSRRAAEAIRGLAAELRAAHGLGEEDMPMTAQERWRLGPDAQRRA